MTRRRKPRGPQLHCQRLTDEIVEAIRSREGKRFPEPNRNEFARLVHLMNTRGKNATQSDLLGILKRIRALNGIGERR